MHHLKKFLITPMIKFFRYRISLLIVFAIISSNLRAVNLRPVDVVVAEVTVKNYSFMNELANLIDKTPKITNVHKKKSGKYFYRLEISPLNSKTKDITPLSFYPKGSYSIFIEYIDYFSIAIPYKYIFSINNIQFVSCQDLTPYYTSCKRERQVLSFEDSIITSGIYWYISIKDGKIDKAFFLNAEYDDSAYNTVYNLLSGETMLESEYIDNGYKMK